MSAGAGRLAGLRVLVVDDDPDIRAAMSIALRAEGAVIDDAPDGSTALHRASATRPDAVVLDMMLPGQSGFSVLEKVRAMVPPVPVVMVTANQGKRHAALAESMGAAAYLVKPVPLGRLVDAVCRAASR
ncbi:MAG: response regulator [Planctomycetes bacterium]|nr:response regulator [Planctomycetota bacterium]